MDLILFVKSLGYLGIWGIIFAESGILLAVMLPGEFRILQR
jgi:membrane-associated protein